MSDDDLAEQCRALIEVLLLHDPEVVEQVALEYLAIMAQGSPTTPLFDDRLEADAWAATSGVADIIRHGIAIAKRLEVETLGTHARRALGRAVFGAMSQAERKRIYTEFPVY